MGYLHCFVVPAAVDGNVDRRRQKGDRPVIVVAALDAQGVHVVVNRTLEHQVHRRCGRVEPVGLERHQA